ncbi:MAG: hypothetical protein IT459_02380 [Planctomycetes bacterium]|nr:hypothetical protein [Planctomycetota bacterium]
MTSTDPPRECEVAYEIPEAEWEFLKSFHHEVQRLEETRFVQNRRGGQISLKWSIGQPLKSNADPVDVEEVAALLLRLRPFVLKDEPYYFHKVKKLLKRRLEHKALRNQLDLLDSGFELRTMQQQVRIMGRDRHVISVPFVMDWLNAYEYHRNSSKREAVEADLGILRDSQNGLPVMLFALVEMIKAIQGLDGLVEALIKVEARELPGFTCPAEWLSTS